MSVSSPSAAGEIDEAEMLQSSTAGQAESALVCIVMDRCSTQDNFRIQRSSTVSNMAINISILSETSRRREFIFVCVCVQFSDTFLHIVHVVQCEFSHTCCVYSIVLKYIK